MFSKKKLFVFVMCSILTCGLFCGSYLLTNVEAQQIPDIPSIDDDIDDDITDDIVTPPTDGENQDGQGGDTSSPTDPEDPVYNYLTSVKSYRNGFTAYNDAIKYLETCDSYQINSAGYLNATILGQSLNGTIDFKTIYKDDVYYNKFSMYSSLTNLNIQSASNEDIIRYRYNHRNDLNNFKEWSNDIYSEMYELLNRKIVAGEINEDNASISGFRKTIDGFSFVVNLYATDLFENISSLVKNISNIDIGLHFESASISFQLNKYGAPVTATYNIEGQVTTKGVTVAASVYLLERYGNYNKDLTIDSAIFGDSQFTA